MTNNELVLLTEENITPELARKALNSTMGIHYETNSPTVRKILAQETRKMILNLHR